MADNATDQVDDRNVAADEKGKLRGEALHAHIMSRASIMWRAERDNIEKGREDQRYYAGDQWPAQDKVDRDRERRPAIVVNRLTQFVRQVTGDIRKDPPVTKVLPAKDATQPVADIFSGLIRNIEQQSHATSAYVQATDNACQVGMGAWRIVTEYENDNAFEQVIRIKRIQDPFAVMFDPAATQPDKSDGDDLMVIDDIAQDKFKLDYPGKSVDDFPSAPMQGFIWRTDDTVRVCEFWWKEPTTRTIILLDNGAIIEDGDDIPPGAKETNRREVKTHKIMQVLASGKELLTEPAEQAGRYIPIVPVIGEEIRFEGHTIRRGMIRDAKGPQQVYNYMRTAAVEIVAKQPAAAVVLTVKQVAGYEDDWADAGSGNKAYLVYNHDPAAPGAPQRLSPPASPQGLDQQAVISANDIEAVIGIYKPSLGAQSNETSGRAIIARQKEADTGSFYFIDNLRTSLAYSGKILLDLIPKIYDTARIVRVLKEDGTHDMVPINQEAPPELDDMTDPELIAAVKAAMNDLTVGEYDVVVSTGPGYQTKRQESSESMMQFMQAVPQAAARVADLVAKNQDWPGADEFAKRLAPPEGPPPIDPKVAASAEKDLAQANLLKAQTETVQIGNTEAGVHLLSEMTMLKTTMQTVLAQLQMGIAPLPPGAVVPPPQQMPGPPPDASPSAPPPAAPAEPLELHPLP